MPPSPAQLRQQFLATGHTLRNERRDFPEWRQGRAQYVLWGIDADTPAVRARVQAAQQALDGLLLAPYQRQPHITLAVCGFPAQSQPSAPDEFDAQDIAAQLAALRTQAPGAFAIEIGSLESFAAAPFLTVRDDGQTLAALHRCLHTDADDPQHPQGAYVPHVTVGLYADAWPCAQVAERFALLADAPPLPFAVRRLHLLGYEAAEIGGALFTLAEYDLASGRMHWRAPPPWPPQP